MGGLFRARRLRTSSEPHAGCESLVAARNGTHEAVHHNRPQGRERQARFVLFCDLQTEPSFPIFSWRWLPLMEDRRSLLQRICQLSRADGAEQKCYSLGQGLGGRGLG